MEMLQFENHMMDDLIGKDGEYLRHEMEQNASVVALIEHGPNPHDGKFLSRSVFMVV